MHDNCSKKEKSRQSDLCSGVGALPLADFAKGRAISKSPPYENLVGVAIQRSYNSSNGKPPPS
jgi:hypothetical protein